MRLGDVIPTPRHLKVSSGQLCSLSVGAGGAGDRGLWEAERQLQMPWLGDRLERQQAHELRGEGQLPLPSPHGNCARTEGDSVPRPSPEAVLCTFHRWTMDRRRYSHLLHSCGVQASKAALPPFLDLRPTLGDAFHLFPSGFALVLLPAPHVLP